MLKWPFKRKEKRYYRIMWSYFEPGATYTDYIKAKDIAQACKKLHKQVNAPGLIIKKIEVFTNEG